MRASPLVPIFLIVFVDILGMSMLMPLLPFYAQSLGANALQVGLLMSVYAFCQLVAGPPLGALSDRLGRKPVLLGSQLGTFAGFLLLANASNLWIAFLSRIIDGFTAGNISVAQAYISDVTRPTERTRSFGILGMAFGLAFLIGPAATGYLAQHFGERTAIYGAAALSALSIVATTVLLPRNPPRPPDSEASMPPARRAGLLDIAAYGEYLRRPELAPLFVQFFCFAFGFSTFMGGFALFAQQRFTWNGQPFGTSQVSLCMTYAGLIGAILQGGLLGRLVRRFGEWKLLGAALVGATLCSAVLAFSSTIPLLLLSFTISSVGGLTRPLMAGLMSHAAGAHEQGVVIGISQSLNSVALIFGPLLAGILIQQHWLTAWGLLAAALPAIGFAFYLGTPARPAAGAPQPLS